MSTYCFRRSCFSNVHAPTLVIGRPSLPITASSAFMSAPNSTSDYNNAPFWYVALVLAVAARYQPNMSMRILLPGFVPPCLPTNAPTPRTGEAWLHEIKHKRIPYAGAPRCGGRAAFTRNGHNWTGRYLAIAAAVAKPKKKQTYQLCLLPPSPPAEKAAAREDQARKASTGYRGKLIGCRATVVPSIRSWRCRLSPGLSNLVRALATSE